MQRDDLVRKRRNQAIYDVAGLITENEARPILEHAVSFVTIVKSRIDHERMSAKLSVWMRPRRSGQAPQPGAQGQAGHPPNGW